MNLTEREKKLVYLAGSFLLFLLLFLSWHGLQNNMQKLKTNQRKVDLERQKLLKIFNEYNELRQFQNAPQSDEDEIVPYMETKLQAYNLRDKTKSMMPAKTPVGKKYIKFSVNIRLEKVAAEPVLRMLREIEQDKSKAYRVDSFLSRKVFKSVGLYNISLKISGFKKK
ncbi:MAG: hypothetical protein D6767_05765 [Candidatus Hydrogenedentota bacterium]|nr:MAG: hypothetical protein D6767_05765 [Candidatus Hydrogenedentota bacterium]